MSVRTQFDEDNDLYSLGDDIDGVFVTFATVPGTAVRGRVADAAAVAAAAPAAPAATTTKVTGNTGDDFDPADFTDNGDGSFTRKSDGIQGRFTPTGFEPITAP